MVRRTVQFCNFDKMRGNKIYIVLVSGTAIIIALMLLFDYRQQQYEKKILISTEMISQLGSGENIDQLFLNANDLSISEKKAFINIYLKFPKEIPGVGKKEMKDRIDEIYNSILKRRIEQTSSKQKDNFSVKPVPK